jgi:small subunit ribosomal protein S1
MSKDDMEDNDTAGEESFADLLAKSFVEAGRLEPGQKVEATVLKITGDWVFVDIGQKGEGVVDKKELLDADGQLKVAEGDRIPVYFLSSRGGEMRFTARVGGDAGLGQLEEAWRGGIPVEGVVEKEVKGGFEVKVAGRRAFCPYSQIALRGGSPEEFVGRHLSFRIAQYGEGGATSSSPAGPCSRRSAPAEGGAQGNPQEGQTVRGTVTGSRTSAPSSTSAG